MLQISGGKYVFETGMSTPQSPPPHKSVKKKPKSPFTKQLDALHFISKPQTYWERIMRNLLIGSGVLVGIVVVAGIILTSNLDGIVKAAIEEGGSKVTGTDVSVSSVSISLTDGKATIKGFTVANPEGYKTAHAIAFDEVTIDLDMERTSKDGLYITLAKVIGPKVSYESSGPGGVSNVDALQAIFEKNTGMERKSDGANSSNDHEEEGEAPKIVIDKLVIEDTQVSVSVLSMDPFSVNFDGIEMNDIGKEDDGASAGDIIDAYMGRIVPAITSEIMKVNTEAITGIVTDLGSGGADSVKGLVDGLGSGGSDTVDGASDAVEGAGKALKGLFGN
jgi:hypothetical protein